MAQEYAAVLGRAQLDARLHDLLPDEGCTEPGHLHTRLLSLPWADVFTTNYDTLLERTLEVDRRQLTPSIQRRYQIVKVSADLPFSRSNGTPRIVKLHGTLRASAPLIITEEDYRCYPREHAPFVNMVQQSMLENVFCLLGFSGDDPNFIEWSGWTRDRLGPQAPPIYLITLEPVTEGQRLILEERKIFPIPIGTLASAGAEDWIQDAFGALLDFWHGQPPPRPAAWGEGYRMPNTLDANPVAQLIEWARSAREVRLDYPGWLVAPEGNRERVASRCGAVLSRHLYQKHGSSMSPELRLVYLFEVNWILETTLAPLTKAHADDYELALVELYRNESAKLAPRDFTEDFSYGTAETRQHWEGLAVALIRYFRETRDAAKFEFWKQEFLNRVSGGRGSETLRWMRYEETLFQLESFQHEEAREVLENWYVYADTADPYWLVRAGALFGELGDTERGQRLAQAGLHKIRSAIQTDGETTYLVSREHWAELVLRVASTASDYSESKWSNRQGARFAELPRIGAIVDGASQTSSIQLDAPTPPKAIPRKAHARESADHPEHQIELIQREFGRFAKILTEATFNFDGPQPVSRHHRVSISEDALAAAFSYVRMVEMSGYVPRFGELALSARTLIEAFTVLSTTNPVESTIRVLLRANATHRFTTLDALTRENVCRLSRDAAEILIHRAFALADANLTNGHDSLPAAKVHKIIFALELISRLLCRLDQDVALDALRRFLRWHDLPSVQHEDGLHAHFKDYFHRVLCALRPEVVTPFLSALIALKPQPETLSRMSRWPRVVQELMDRIPVDVTQKDWLSVANGALDDARLAKDDETMMAFHLGRLDWLFTHQLLSVSQSRALAALVWGGVPTGTLPATVPGFYHGALLTWPAPQRINKQAIFKSWVLAQPLADIVERFEEDGVQKRSITPRQENLLTNILLTRNVRNVFAWTSNELLAVSDNLRAWWIREGRRLVGEAAAENEDGFSRPLLIRRMRLLGHVLQRIVTPDISRDDALAASIPEWLSEMWEASRQLGAPMPQFLFAALHWWPDRTSIVLRIATESIASATEQNFTTAMHAAGHWLIRNRQPSAASRQYLSLLVNAITLRLDGRLDAVLTSICELLTLGAVAHFGSCVDTLFPTLRGLLDELQGHEYDTGLVDVESRAQLRQRTVKAMTLLVGAFPTLGGNDWQRCQELAAADPLVEVRNLVPLH
ncbi:SIR2 family NAD-dependent protein deacylase [Paraburkholderia kirstenboschensis]|uniref:SIR2 family protein n=1 Tax=Paraburkholderia kirstenboschensis TaxID=1245436 RepID=A0ABZ0ELN5_9BURK|nr:SIR2 family protein [Paraburkholderia kirstenboschensis]WOD17018.1 SIR2 family protein [Paraburkholderia kirstenboschensis]